MVAPLAPIAGMGCTGFTCLATGAAPVTGPALAVAGVIVGAGAAGIYFYDRHQEKKHYLAHVEKARNAAEQEAADAKVEASVLQRAKDKAESELAAMKEQLKAAMEELRNQRGEGPDPGLHGFKL